MFDYKTIFKFKDPFTFTAPSEINTKPLVACILAANTSKTNFIFQIYLQKEDSEFFDSNALNTRRHFDQEVFKSDIYVILDAKALIDLKECLVVGIKEFIATDHVIATEEPIKLRSTDIFVCESMYSTFFKIFRKISTKKWCPLAFLTGMQH